MTAWKLAPLSAEHERSTFNCGQLSLDEFLSKFALQNQRKNIGRTFVALYPESNRIAGYYTVVSGSISYETLPFQFQKGLPRYPIPILHLGRLAVDSGAKGKGLGETLLMDALRRARRLAEAEIGICGVEVFALDDSAKAFYLKYGFVALVDGGKHLYLPMKTIQQTLQ